MSKPTIKKKVNTKAEAELETYMRDITQHDLDRHSNSRGLSEAGIPLTYKEFGEYNPAAKSEGLAQFWGGKCPVCGVEYEFKRSLVSHDFPSL